MRSWNGKRENITLKEMKKDLKKPALAPAQSLFGLLIRQSPPVCITVPDSKIAGLGSHHFELPSLSFSSHLSKPLEAARWTFFFDKSATVNVFRKQPENLKTGALASDSDVQS